LKCCINYEAATYADAVKDFPPKDIPLETIDGTWYHFKTDVFKREMTYSSDKRMAANLVVLSVDRVKEIIALNKQGNKPEQLVIEVKDNTPPPPDFQNVVGQDSLTRFDKNNKREKKRGGKDRHERSRDRHADRRNRSGNGQKPEKNQTNPSQPSTNPSNA
jgi:hypothetical protein